MWEVLPPLLCFLAAVQGACNFTNDWKGLWFQSGIPSPVVINSTAISSKGFCVENSNDKFVIEDRKDNCYRCVVIHLKHKNVLQYKETFCEQRDSLENLCGQITGDAILYSMFRTDAVPVQCPFRGPFTFTYNRGSGECAKPESKIDSCTEDYRLLLRYQSCPDVLSTESTVEELVCLATWKDGSTRYLVGKLDHKMATSNEERYRCFVYERHTNRDKKVTYNVAQSGDATCNGILSATEGSRTMKLTKAENHTSKCGYPHWVTDHHRWHTLDNKKSYQFHRNATMHIANKSGESVEMNVVCHSAEEINANQVMFVTHVTTGCQSGYVCMMFYRRDGHVIELQTGSTFNRFPEEACHHTNFNSTTLPYITLITATMKPHKCPYLGRYTVTGVSREDRDMCGGDYVSLVVGCSDTDTMEFHSSCNTEGISAFSCHGSWEDNGTNYLIASPVSRSSKGARRYCYIYTGNDKMLQFSRVTDSCLRNISPGISGIWDLNVTVNGQCAEMSAGPNSALVVVPSVLAFTFFTLVSIGLLSTR